MKFLKSRLLLTVLAPLVFSLSYTNTANAGTLRYTFRNKGYIDLTCRIDNNQSKIVEARGKLGNILASNLKILSQNGIFVKFYLPVDQNGNVNYTKTITDNSITQVFLRGNVQYLDKSVELVDLQTSGPFCN